VGGVLSRPVRAVEPDLAAEVERQRRVGRRAEVRQPSDGRADLAERRVPVEVELQDHLHVVDAIITR